VAAVNAADGHQAGGGALLDCQAEEVCAVLPRDAGLADQLMRRILVDHARKHQAAKRFGEAMKVAWDDRAGATPPLDCELLLLDQALAELGAHDPRQARVVELRYFGGLSEQEAAEVLTVSRATVTRDWNVARAWLFRRMTQRVTEVPGE
jgi:RNA polymerase sigma-70 factor (ECF subfamily)